MNFSESLKKNQDFQSVYRKGRSYANKLLVMYVLENNMERNRLGISVSKKSREQRCASSCHKAGARKLQTAGEYI